MILILVWLVQALSHCDRRAETVSLAMKGSFAAVLNQTELELMFLEKAMPGA